MILECISGVKSSIGGAVRSLREKVLFFPVVAAGRKPDFETAELLVVQHGVEKLLIPSL